MTIRGDSTEYELLKIWCETLPFYEKPKSVKTCEIGVREGLGSQVIMLAIKSRIGDVLYEHIGIDPYGDITYQHYDKSPEYKSNYSDAMRVQLLKDFADNYTPIYLEVIDGLKIQSQLDECILINQKKQKGGK